MCFKILTLDDLSGCMFIRRIFGISWNQWGEHRRMKASGGLNLYKKWSKMVRTFAGRAGLWTRWNLHFRGVASRRWKLKTCFKRLAKVHVQIFDLIPLHPTVHCTSVLEQLLQSMLEVLWWLGWLVSTWITKIATHSSRGWRVLRSIAIAPQSKDGSQWADFDQVPPWAEFEVGRMHS